MTEQLSITSQPRWVQNLVANLRQQNETYKNVIHGLIDTKMNLQAEIADLKAEIGHHYADFLKLRGLCDKWESFGDIAIPIVDIRNIVE